MQHDASTLQKYTRVTFVLKSLLSIPVENFEDHSAPPSPDEKDSGFFMLRKDSERRATLHHILTEDRDKVVANLTEALAQVVKKKSHMKSVVRQTSVSPSASHQQGSEQMKLKPEHISTLVVSLADFVRMADRKIIAGTLSQLKLELDFDSTAISQLQVVLFGFQDAVSVKHRSQRKVTLKPLQYLGPFYLVILHQLQKAVICSVAATEKTGIF